MSTQILIDSLILEIQHRALLSQAFYEMVCEAVLAMRTEGDLHCEMMFTLMRNAMREMIDNHAADLAVCARLRTQDGERCLN
jgi:hypothetical protein